ncbi:response regulator [Pseudoxanthomonas winnipegensis]|uniref:Response regulator n=3 Tax=Pseudoxanthomonas TaxID=83618 RepID=A0ABY1WGF5_9GAMM|nr:response regulator [Pseudoxanthomonas winnipegensis]TAH72481.1 response regulator [Pseudoxanthomonas winnipegensis]
MACCRSSPGLARAVQFEGSSASAGRAIAPSSAAAVSRNGVERWIFMGEKARGATFKSLRIAAERPAGDASPGCPGGQHGRSHVCATALLRRLLRMHGVHGTHTRSWHRSRHDPPRQSRGGAATRTARRLQPRGLDRMGKRLRVLMVDDNAELLRVVQDGLSMYQVDVVTAGSAGEALDLLIRDGGFDVVMSDVLMPLGMSGVQLVEMVAREYPQIAVVLTSGYPQASLPEMPRGVRFLPKPYQFSGLMAALNEEVSLH